MPLPLANLNGRQMPLADVRIPADDRGFLFGDAVYEVVRVYAGRPWLLKEHLARLQQSLEAIRIRGVDLGRLEERICDTIAAGPFEEATVYVQITRGSAARDHAYPGEIQPLELISVAEFPDSLAPLRETGAAVVSHPDIRWGRCDVKSTNLLANVMAIQAAKEKGAVEAILYLPDGTITEGGRMSFFAVRDGRLLTTPITPAILPGITRSFVLKLALQESIAVQEEAVKLNDLKYCKELFLSGTTAEVLPVVKVDEQVIANGRPGAITRRIQRVFQTAVRG